METTPANRETLHWSVRGLADALGIDERQVRRWEAGEYQAPDHITAWLETLAQFHERHPPPPRPPRQFPAAT